MRRFLVVTAVVLLGSARVGVFLQGRPAGATTWSDTICPDGTDSDADGGTCVHDGA